MMNWVGGARSRVKLKEQKKKQKEYFARKKFSQKIEKARHTPSNGKQLSQDLISLQTLSKTHDCGKRATETVHGSHKNKIKVRMVDLSRITSTSKIPKEIDLGPVSPPKRTFQDDPKFRGCESSDNLYRNFTPASERLQCYKPLKEPLSTAASGRLQSYKPLKEPMITAASERLESYKPLKESISKSASGRLDSSKLLNEPMCTDRYEQQMSTGGRVLDFKEFEIEFSGQSSNYVAPGRKNSSTCPGQEMPFNQYSRPPGQNRVTFSNIISTRIQTPSPALYGSGVFSKPFMRGKISEQIKIKRTNQPFWEQDSPMLLKAEEAPKYNTTDAKINLCRSLQKQSDNRKIQSKAIDGNSSNLDGSSQNFSDNSFCKELNRKRDLAYLHEDFQVTPLKKYITKEEYQLKKQKEKQRKQLKREKNIFAKEKNEMQKLEELKKQNSLWSILDDSFYNKIEPCGNKDAAMHKAQEEKPYRAGASMTLNKNRKICVDDAEYNKGVTNCRDNVKESECCMKVTEKTSEKMERENNGPEKESYKEKHRPFWEIVDDAYYNQITQCGQKVESGCPTKEKQRKLNVTQSQESLAAALTGVESSEGKCETRPLNVPAMQKTPSNFMIGSMVENHSASRTDRSLNWLAFISGKRTLQSSNMQTKVITDNDMKKNDASERESLKDPEQISEEVASSETRVVPETAEVQEDVTQGVNVQVNHSVTDSKSEEECLENDKQEREHTCKEDTIELANNTIAKDVLQGLLDNICKKTEEIHNSLEIHGAEIKAPETDIPSSEVVDRDTNTEIISRLDNGTQTEESKSNNQSKQTKNASCECHILKDFPVTVNRFTQTSLEEFTKVYSTGTSTEGLECRTTESMAQTCGGTNNLNKEQDTRRLEPKEIQNVKNTSKSSSICGKSEEDNATSEPVAASGKVLTLSECRSKSSKDLFSRGEPKDLPSSISCNELVVADASRNGESNIDFTVHNGNRYEVNNRSDQSEMDFREIECIHNWIKRTIVDNLLARVNCCPSTQQPISSAVPITEVRTIKAQVDSHYKGVDTTRGSTDKGETIGHCMQNVFEINLTKNPSGDDGISDTTIINRSSCDGLTHLRNNTNTNSVPMAGVLTNYIDMPKNEPFRNKQEETSPCRATQLSELLFFQSSNEEKAKSSDNLETTEVRYNLRSKSKV